MRKLAVFLSTPPCARLSFFCGKAQEKLRLSWCINSDLYIGSLITHMQHVVKTCEKALMLSTFTHKQSTAIFTQITERLVYLSTFSTPPITTTTKYINI
jgi:hypothetical protein